MGKDIECRAIDTVSWQFTFDILRTPISMIFIVSRMNLVVNSIIYFLIVSSSFYTVWCEDIIDGKSKPTTTRRSNDSGGKWISQLFKEAETLFQITSTANVECKKHFDVYRLHLRNQSIWAVKMLESSEWPSVGLFSGRTYHLGDYDECLSVSSYGINGQYCLVETAYNYTHDSAHSRNAVENPSQMVSVWEAITMYRSNQFRADRQKIKFAVCIPSSCTTDDLTTSLNRTLSPVFESQTMNITVNVYPTSCRTKLDESNYSWGFYIVSCLLGSIFLLVISSTWSDLSRNNNGENNDTEENINHLSAVYRSFSSVRNLKILKETNQESDYPILHFIKVLNMILVIYIHRFLHFIESPKFNSEALEQTWKWPRMDIIHADIINVFFMVSGFLMYYRSLSSAKKEGTVFPFLNILSRWLRLIPSAGILMLYVMYVLPHTSDGPLWNDQISEEVNPCKESWWVLLLGVNNLIKPDRMCMLVTWYISTDIQLTSMGGILLLIFCKNTKLGICAVSFAFICSMGISFMVVYLNQYHGTYILSMNAVENYRKDIEFINMYMAPYPRVGPYLIGFICAIVTKTLINKKYKFSTKQSLLLCSLAVLVSEGTAQYSFLFYIFERDSYRLENAVYAAVHHWLFVLQFAVPICVSFTSGLGILEKIFNWKGFIPLGRLTYSFYLINMIVQKYHSYSQRQVTQSHLRLNLIWSTFGDIIWIYVIGFFLYLFIEAPITNISKILRKELFKLIRRKNLTNERTKEIESIQNNSVARKIQ